MRIKELRKQLKLTQVDLAKMLNVSRSALAMWETGGVEPSNDKLLKLAEIFDVSVDYLLGAPPTGSTPVVRIPVVGQVAAGIPIEAIEEIVDWEEIPESLARTGEFFGLKIRGRSMEPRIMEGDIVIVRRQEDVSSGDTAIVLVNAEEGTCKKVVKHDGGGISLISYNPSIFPPRFYTPDEVRALPVVIIGKVVELRGKL